MKPIEIARIKADLLCYGVRLDKDAMQKCAFKNSYLLDGGFVHAAHFLIEDVVINTCISESFCMDSPYLISNKKDRFVLSKDETVLCDVEILEMPIWGNKTVGKYVIGDYLRPHSKNCISCCPTLSCSFFEESKPCMFCSVGPYSCVNDLVPMLPQDTIAQMVKIALEYNPAYEVALSGGTCATEDRTAIYFCEICAKILELTGLKPDISIELAPPEKDLYIDKLFEVGATSIIMNLEIADDLLRKKICPGKSKIMQSRYFSAFEHAVSVFGRGKVSSVLIAGLQPVDDIISMSSRLIDMGVIPTIIPFKPLDDCLLKGASKANPEDVFTIALAVDKMLRAANLSASQQGGCTKCGGCSLESVFQLI